MYTKVRLLFPGIYLILSTKKMSLCNTASFTVRKERRKEGTEGGKKERRERREK